MLQQAQPRHPEGIQQLLNCGGSDRYAFHWCANPVPPLLLIHRQHQQDALRHSWTGLVAGTDGSVDERTEAMGAGYVLGADTELMIGVCPHGIYFGHSMPPTLQKTPKLNIYTKI